MGRPKKDPYTDATIIAGLQHMKEFDAIPDTGTPAQDKKRWLAARRVAVDKMYLLEYGNSPESDNASYVSLDTIKTRKDNMRRKLKSVVRYTSMEQTFSKG